MSKLETVKALNDLKPQLQIVASVKTLQQAIQQMSDDMSQLPGAVSTETAKVLEPLTSLSQDVKKALEAYDLITAAQRQTLDNLTEEQRQQIEQLLKPISASAEQISGMKSTVDQMSTDLNKDLVKIKNATNEVHKTAIAARPRFWKILLMLVASAALGAMLVAAGQTALNRLVPPSGVQQDATWAAVVWNKATPEERELLKKIVNRPAN